MLVNITKLFNDFSIQFVTEGHKHARRGWVQTECPFCTGNPGYHLGYNLAGGYFNCWRCGWKPFLKTLARLLNTSINEARFIARQYALKGKALRQVYYEQAPEKREGREWAKLPPNVCSLLPSHVKYLESRGLDVEELKELWKIRSVGPVGPFKHRVLIPLFWDNRLVSYQARDVTGKQSIRYKACPKEWEAIHHKHLVYGLWEALRHGMRKVIITEGPIDVWKLGIGGVCTFGISFTQQQAMLLARNLDKAFIAFDNEKQAWRSAKKLAAELGFYGVECEVIRIPEEFNDIGEMPLFEARKFKAKFLGMI